MGKTGISWTDETWNPTKGCSRTAPAGSNQSGCGDSTGGGCYAEQQAGRIVRMAKGKPCAYDGLVRLTAKGYRWTGKVPLFPDALALPLKWREPRRVFVNSMSDLFHEALTNEQIAAVFGVMAACPQHTFQVLTKRARRMREWFEWLDERERESRAGSRGRIWDARAYDCWGFARDVLRDTGRAIDSSVWNSEMVESAHLKPWPLPHVWLGVSVENQAAADERIPELLQTPAAIRFLSCEPLIGPVRLGDAWLRGRFIECPDENNGVDVDPCEGCPAIPNDGMRGGDYCGAIRGPHVDWVIAGCESGPGARPCDVEWLRSLRDQCAGAGVAFFLKQAVELVTTRAVYPSKHADRATTETISFGEGSRRKPGGVIELPYLDGVQHAAFPEVTR